jgi:hypothetical protein
MEIKLTKPQQQKINKELAEMITNVVEESDIIYQVIVDSVEEQLSKREEVIHEEVSKAIDKMINTSFIQEEVKSVFVKAIANKMDL